MFIWGPPRERHLVVATETEARTVSKRAVRILLECFLVISVVFCLLKGSLKFGGQSGSVEYQSRWPGDQIRLPRANGSFTPSESEHESENFL